MNDNTKYISVFTEFSSMQQMLNKSLIVASEIFDNELKYLNINNYQYTTDLAVEELGLEVELIEQLIEDYISQIIKSIPLFEQHLNKLKENKKLKLELDYTDMRELAHKNLGVARNLRIEDAEKILFRMMKTNELDCLLVCLNALLASTIILKPKYAYEIIKLIKIKNSL